MKTTLLKAAEDLFTFAIDRQDIKWTLDHLPHDPNRNRPGIDYELQILKLLSVGWGLTYLLADSAFKAPLQNAYWEAVREFSERLSSTSGLLTGQQIDYFGVLKTRLDTYLAAMPAGGSQEGEPGRTIGAAFARICGRDDDPAIMMAAARMFTHSLSIVNEYLSTSGCYE